MLGFDPLFGCVGQFSMHVRVVPPSPADTPASVRSACGTPASSLAPPSPSATLTPESVVPPPVRGSFFKPASLPYDPPPQEQLTPHEPKATTRIKIWDAGLTDIATSDPASTADSREGPHNHPDLSDQN